MNRRSLRCWRKQRLWLRRVTTNCSRPHHTSIPRHTIQSGWGDNLLTWTRWLVRHRSNGGSNRGRAALYFALGIEGGTRRKRFRTLPRECRYAPPVSHVRATRSPALLVRSGTNASRHFRGESSRLPEATSPGDAPSSSARGLNVVAISSVPH